MSELVNAYLNTDYWVRLPGGWLQLAIGKNPPIDHGALTDHAWLIITACNPASIRLNNNHNFVRHCLLSEALATAGLSGYPSLAQAEADQPEWPAEYGWLVPGGHWQVLFQLADQFGQYAVVTHRPGDAVHLCIMRDQSPPVTAIDHPHIEYSDGFPANRR